MQIPFLRPRAEGRIAVLDLARGAALLGMVVYHVGWDLYWLGLSPVDVTAEPLWMVLQRVVLGSFLFLAGFGVFLSHRSGIRWPAFWRRFAVLFGAALLVTMGTLIGIPEGFVFFGVLHAIALFSLLALPFLRAPAWLVAAIAVVVISLPFAFSDPAFNSRELSWIGFWVTPPVTADIVPIFPWFGVLLLGVLAGRFAPLERLKMIQPGFRWLQLPGRWTLPFYLLHQPILFGLLMLIPAPTQPVPEGLSFLRSCTASCTASGSSAAYCTSYCQCALEQVEGGQSWAVINGPDTPDRRQTVAAIEKLCKAMAPGAE